jgi:hypothetical protein
LPLVWNRRKFLRGAAALLGAGAVGVAADATVLEANDPQLVRIDVSLPRLPVALDGFTIAQLSDFHYDPDFSALPLKKAIKTVNDLQPDLIALTGDFVTVPVFSDYFHNAKQGAVFAEACALAVGQLRARYGVLAILGNHDHDSDPDRVIAALGTQAIPVLRNRSVPVEVDGKRLWISGVDDVLTGKPDLGATLKAVPGTEPVVLLAHEPDFADEATRYSIDLQLSGHSHGGQIRFPVIGAPFLPDMARKYPWGLRRVGKLVLYTNIGLGTIRIPARLNCPPEITWFTLRSAAGGK